MTDVQKEIEDLQNKMDALKTGLEAATFKHTQAVNMKQEALKKINDGSADGPRVPGATSLEKELMRDHAGLGDAAREAKHLKTVSMCSPNGARLIKSMRR